MKLFFFFFFRCHLKSHYLISNHKQRYMIRTGLAEMFPKSSEHLGIEPILQRGSFMEGRVGLHSPHPLRSDQEWTVS